jgi:hypothetical protein
MHLIGGKRGYRYRNAASPGASTSRTLTDGSRSSSQQDAKFPHQMRTQESAHVSNRLS